MIAVAISGVAQTVEEKPEVKGETSESLAAVKLANQILRYGYENNSSTPSRFFRRMLPRLSLLQRAGRLSMNRKTTVRRPVFRLITILY